MFYRRAWQRVGPLARWLLKPLSKSTAPLRHMAFSVPGGSSNMAYVILCGGGLTAAVVYAYKTVNGDTERYEDRLANMSSKEKAEIVVEVASSLPAEAAQAEEEPAPEAEIPAESVPASPEPVAETSAEPTAEAGSQESAAPEASEADVTEASAEPVDAEVAPVAEEETVAEITSEVATLTPAEDAAGAAESAAVKALASSTLEIINAFVAEESLVTALHQMEDDGKLEVNYLEGVEPEALEMVLEAEAAADVEERTVEVEEMMQVITIEELSAEQSVAPAAEQEEEISASLSDAVREAEDTTDSATEEDVSSSEASPEDPSSSDEASHTEEVIVPAEATPEEEETESEQITLDAVGETAQLAAASTEPEHTETEPPSSIGPVDEEEPGHNCHTSPSPSKETAPSAAPGEDLLDLDITQEAQECSPLTKQNTENGAVMTAQS